MSRDRIDSAPARLTQECQEMADLFTGAESAYRAGLDEACAWEKLRLRLELPEEAPRGERPKSRTNWGRSANRPLIRRWAWVVGSAAAVVALAWVGSSRYRDSSDPRSRAAQAQQSSPALTAGASIRLAPGRSQLPDGTLVDLTEGAQGTLLADTHRSTLQFDRGHLEIQVAHQPQGRTFAVKTRDIEFLVLGTRFSVTAQAGHVELNVTHGKVLVKPASAAPVIVQAGGHWSNSEPPPVLSAPSPSTHPSITVTAHIAPESSAPSKSTDAALCRTHLRNGEPQAAQDCYVAAAKGHGLSAEMALYEVARLRRDVLKDPLGALSALDEYEARFQSGTLAPEVRVARVQLLSRLGRSDEALEASEVLLATTAGHSRAAELRLLRGNLLRDHKNDCAAAITEYRVAAADSGARGEQALFATAGCLERLGRAADAAEAYRQYLQRSNPTQAEQARRRLLELTQ